jgi:ribosomal protein S18 acetylase RimI-like enzyme
VARRYIKNIPRSYVLVTIQKAILDDHSQLAEMNLALIHAENYDNKLPIEKLIPRMKDFLETDYEAFWVFYKNEKCGYILINKSRDPLYIRQFYILPNYQRKGIGEKTIYLIKNHYNTKVFDVEVMAWNQVGINFWEKMGFKLRCYSMRLS